MYIYAYSWYRSASDIAVPFNKIIHVLLQLLPTMTAKMNNNCKNCNSGEKPPRVGIIMPPTDANLALAKRLQMRLGKKGRKFNMNIMCESILEDCDEEASE